MKRTSIFGGTSGIGARTSALFAAKIAATLGLGAGMFTGLPTGSLLNLRRNKYKPFKGVSTEIAAHNAAIDAAKAAHEAVRTTPRKVRKNERRKHAAYILAGLWPAQA